MSQPFSHFPIKQAGRSASAARATAIVLPPPLREACDQADFLADYLHHVPWGTLAFLCITPNSRASYNRWTA
ncbi:MAG: hypothetical protein H6661_14230 [Ardenticatenaceae bacterium]|nr:hypothetical protein [Ardenticatenaceae bacterium]